MRPKLKVLIAESLSGDDLYAGRREGVALAEILNLAGLSCTSMVVHGTKHLKKALRQADSIDANVFHLSCHGNDEGIQLLSGEELAWDVLADLCQRYTEPNRAIVLSCCQGGVYGLTREIKEKPKRVGWVFGCEGDVEFTDACICWAMLYRQISRSGLEPGAMKEAIRLMNGMSDAGFNYRRWTGKSYRRHPSK